MKHIHAELMMQYAQDALETDIPWKRWEYFGVAKKWEQCYEHPKWNDSFNYRRKPKIVNINGFEIPEPIRSASLGTMVYIADPHTENLFYIVEAGHVKSHHFESGLAHATKEAAILHAKALLSFTHCDLVSLMQGDKSNA